MLIIHYTVGSYPEHLGKTGILQKVNLVLPFEAKIEPIRHEHYSNASVDRGSRLISGYLQRTG